MQDADLDQYADQDQLKSFRTRNLRILGWTSVPFLAPFAIYNFFIGRTVIGLVLLALTTLGLVNATGIWRDRNGYATSCYFIIGTAGLAYAIYHFGITVSYWSFPALLALPFLGERRESRLVMAIALAVLIPVAYVAMPAPVATRFLVTLALVCFISDRVVMIFGELQAQLAHLAAHDPLTGALNRRQMRRCLEDAQEGCRRGLGPASTVLLDVDAFKAVNDDFGHAAGDRVLKSLVETIQARKRRLDKLFRVGGEEFALVLLNTPLDNARHFADELRKLIERAPLLEGRAVTASFGVAQHADGEDVDNWLRRADRALYAAKNGGRNCVQVDNTLVTHPSAGPDRPAGHKPPSASLDPRPGSVG